MVDREEPVASSKQILHNVTVGKKLSIRTDAQDAHQEVRSTSADKLDAHVKAPTSLTVGKSRAVGSVAVVVLGAILVLLYYFN